MAIKLESLSHKELVALIADAKARVHGVRDEQIRALRAKVEALVKAEELTMAEVFPVLGGGKEPSKRAGAGIPKFRNPDDESQTWTGFGKKPGWFVEALKKRGVTVDSLRIDA
jgi:DNA-binding protein H-NS